MKTLTRLAAAVVLSPLIVAPLYLILAIVTRTYDSMMILLVMEVATLIAYIGVLTVGLPVHLYLVRRGMTRRIDYAGPGFLAPVLLVVVTHPFGADGMLMICVQAVLMGFFGASVAVAFRSIALGNLDKLLSFDD